MDKENHAFCSVSVLLFQRDKANSCLCYALRLQIAFEDQEKERAFCAAAEWPLHSQPTLKEMRLLPNSLCLSRGVCTETAAREQHVFKQHSRELHSY